MERQTLLMGVALFVLMVLTGFYAGFLMDSDSRDNEQNLFSTEMNVTASDDNDIATVSFDNKSVDIFYEDTPEAKFYIDLNQDGSSDIQIDDLTHDGDTYSTTEIITLNSQNYRLYMTYRDSPETRNDGWITVYQVREVG
jgi:hypothetical protein